MARLNPLVPRVEGTRKQFLGKLIIFCEGKTEYNYFNHFARIVNGNRDKYSHIRLEPINTEGNSRHVLNYAESFFKEGSNSSYYSTYEKYLVFDCDAPEDIQSVINEMRAATKTYELLLTNILFETWLLMHFEVVENRLTKFQTYRKIIDALRVEKYKSKEKASEGIIRKAIGNGDNVKFAIQNAKTLEKKYKEENLNIDDNIVNMNPFTLVHILVDRSRGRSSASLF